MLIENEQFSRENLRDGNWGENVYRYCEFDGVDIDGINFSGAMVNCSIRKLRAYWGLFNCVTLSGVTFSDCDFPGTSFRGCRLIGCTFERCRFCLDNLGGTMTIDNCILADCIFEGCSFEQNAAKKAVVFAKGCKVLGCSFQACVGLEKEQHLKAK